jgi:hypothetical protein
MVTATPTDVRVELDTTLDDPAISDIIGRVARDIDREPDPPADDTDDRQDLEAVLAALHIATQRDRTASEAQTGRTAQTYEASTVQTLRERARRLGASESLIPGAIRRDTDRHVWTAEGDG